MFMWMCIVSEMVWCTSFFVWGQGTRSGKNVCLKILCVHTKFLRGVEVGWEYVDYHGGSKYNKGW